ncbi:MAG: aspartate carbamoyltransferase [Candidatus Pacearchaeota archaeon]
MINHVIKSQQFNSEDLYELFNRAEELEKNVERCLENKIMVTLFYEPSTRTRLSFESAMIKLGGSVISTENAKEFSSAIKGESLEDSIRVVDDYCDVIVLRHYEEGSSERASRVSKVPIINAGDGKGQHPTQALLDVYTIYKELGYLEGLNIALVGDLANGRTVRSLSYLISKFDGNTLFFISPPHLRMKDDIKEYLRRKNVKFYEKNDLNELMPIFDVVYMTRIQRERMSSEEYEKAKGRYVINKFNLNRLNPDSIIMHPLPHVEEINLPIDIEESDKRIAYFRQARNGLYIRMALLDYVINNRRYFIEK